MFDLRTLKDKSIAELRILLEDPEILTTPSGKATVQAMIRAQEATAKAERAMERAEAIAAGRAMPRADRTRKAEYQGQPTLGSGDRLDAVLLASTGGTLTYPAGPDHDAMRERSMYWTTDNVLRVLCSYFEAVKLDVPESIKVCRANLKRWDDDKRPMIGMPAEQSKPAEQSPEQKPAEQTDEQIMADLEAEAAAQAKADLEADKGNGADHSADNDDAVLASAIPALA